jgi:hypothetical protein
VFCGKGPIIMQVWRPDGGIGIGIMTLSNGINNFMMSLDNRIVFKNCSRFMIRLTEQAGANHRGFKYYYGLFTDI